MKNFNGNELLSLKYNQIDILVRDDNKEVYLGERKEDNKKVVIKQINLLDEQLKKNIKDEGMILSYLEHLNIIKYYDYIFEKNKEIIIMEYAEGGNLKEKIEEKKAFEENKIIDWFIEICEGIQYIHNKKIIHRDLKLNNIFLTKDNHIKIGDFGMSNILYNESQSKTNKETSFYLIPEIINGQSYDYKSDIWNLGIILYQLTQLKHPFIDDNISIEKRMNNIKKGKYSDFVNKNYSERLLNLIKNILKVNPNERLSIDEIIDECNIIKIKNNSKFKRE